MIDSHLMVFSHTSIEHPPEGPSRATRSGAEASAIGGALQRPCFRARVAPAPRSGSEGKTKAAGLPPARAMIGRDPGIPDRGHQAKAGLSDQVLHRATWDRGDNSACSRGEKGFSTNALDAFGYHAWSCLCKAGAPGFEPRSTDPKSGVLPLHHAPIQRSPEGDGVIVTYGSQSAPLQPSIASRARCALWLSVIGDMRRGGKAGVPPPRERPHGSC